MDNFGNIFQDMGSGSSPSDDSVFVLDEIPVRNNNNISGKRSRVREGYGADGSYNSVGTDGASDNSHLENMSDSALNDLVVEYKNQISSSSSNEGKNVLQSRINAIKSELNKRSGAGQENNSSSVSAQVKSSLSGASMTGWAAAGALSGFLGSMMVFNSSHPVRWGFIGAVAGAALSYSISNTGNSTKVIQPV